MGLPCGDNEALGALSDLGNSLKEKLAAGKDALGDLSSLQDQITAKLGDLKMPELEIPNSSLQEDLQALSTKFGQEFSDAQTALREKWGDFVDDIDEKISSIPSLDQILSGDATLPDLCKEVENLELATTTDAEGNTVATPVLKAAPAATPNVNAEAPPDFESAINQAFSRLSTGNSASGESFISVAFDYGIEVDGAVAVIFGKYFNPAREKLDELKAEWEDTPEWRAVKALARDTGLTYAELSAEGHLTSDQAAVNRLRLAYAGEAAALNKISADTQELVKGHKKLMVGVMTQDRFDVGWSHFKELYGDDTALIAMVEEVFAHQVEKKDLIIRFNNYTNQLQ